MTLLVLWQAVHTNKISSIYIGSDSRITWTLGEVQAWDFATKVFACNKSPEIFGYCGDVLFPTLMLSSLVMLIDRESIIKPDMELGDKFKIVSEYFAQGLEPYPKDFLAQDFTIVYCTKSKGKFGFLELTSTSKGLEIKPLEPYQVNGQLTSHHIQVYGTGKDNFIENLKNYQNVNENATPKEGKEKPKNIVEYRSAGVFLALCDALEDEEPSVGGAPQLVGIYRNSSYGEVFGIIQDNQRYLMGKPIKSENIETSIEWRNDQFENCDFATGERKTRAARNPRPRKES